MLKSYKRVISNMSDTWCGYEGWSQQTQALYSSLSIQMLPSSSTHFARPFEMPARCFTKCALLSKTRPVQNFAVLNSLKSHYNKIPPKLLVDFVPRLLSRTTESLRWRVWGWEKGRKFHYARKWEEKNYPWTGNQRPHSGKIGRSSENFSTLLRPYISSEKNNGYFLPRFSASVEMKTPRLEIPRNEKTPVLIRFAITTAQLIIIIELN